jgi:hypothetical protein
MGQVEVFGKLEYELDANGKRTGRWRPRGKPTPWRSSKTAMEPVEKTK